MKRVLITGANSYIGRSFMNYVAMDSEFIVEELDVRTDKWEVFDFSNFDIIFHVAAIVHKNEKNVSSELYSIVNRDLPLKIAKKAKNSGVAQFIFLSSMSVYSDQDEVISKDTETIPSSLYGKSKLEAEKMLRLIESETFKIAILRPPMVYGPDAVGNYRRLSKLASVLPFFIKVNNQRSMIFIGNLCEFVKKVIAYSASGLFFPQNSEYICTSEMFQEIRNIHGKKTLQIKLSQHLVNLFYVVKPFKKMFSNLVYDQSLSKYEFNYDIYDFKSSLVLSEKKEIR
ncbi:NAD-dependent epimerase/dehydratase family protein [Streptococcus caprae]|uniref:NAD-dependent epimerase/dehydratase family protein n=1 Tax=Streptococcus caprae TaxID=1640501 RepID=A0ABV8CTE7_9STRE